MSRFVAAPDKRGLRIFDREHPLDQWMSAEKWLDLEDCQ